jgi:hypothetical protein
MLGADFYSLAFSPDSHTLAAGSQGGVYLYDLGNLENEPVFLSITAVCVKYFETTWCRN